MAIDSSQQYPVYMIGRFHRFHGRNSLRHVYGRGQTVRGPLCSIKLVANNRRQDYRVAVVVSKKVSKSAVVRNRIRRRVYEIIRGSALAGQPYDVVVTVFSEQLAVMPADDLEQLITRQLQQAGIG